jgi:hypothetical protein
MNRVISGLLFISQEADALAHGALTQDRTLTTVVSPPHSASWSPSDFPKQAQRPPACHTAAVLENDTGHLTDMHSSATPHVTGGEMEAPKWLESTQRNGAAPSRPLSPELRSGLQKPRV